MREFRVGDQVTYKITHESAIVIKVYKASAMARIRFAKTGQVLEVGYEYLTKETGK